MRIRTAAVKLVSLRNQSVIPSLYLKIKIDTYTTPAIVGAVQVHATLEATTFAVLTTDCCRVALGDTVGTAVIWAEPAFVPRTAAVVDANSVIALYLKEFMKTYLPSGHGLPLKHGSATSRLTSGWSMTGVR